MYCNREVLTKIKIIDFISNKRNLPYLIITRHDIQNKDKTRFMNNKEKLLGSLMRYVDIKGIV